MNLGLELKRKLFSFIITFLLLTILVLNPLAFCTATLKKQLIILDLPYLDWSEISGDSPHLLKLLETGSAGLTSIPSVSETKGFYSGILPVLGKIRFKSSTIVAVSTGAPGTPCRSNPVIIIDGSGVADSIAKRADALNDSDTSSIKNATDSILELYRMVRDRAKIIAITFNQNSRSTKMRSENGSQWAYFYDALISRIWAETDFDTTLLMACFSQPSGMDCGLTPVLLKGLDFKEGVLYSPSTRQKGIMTWGDLRAAVLQFLKPGKSQMVFQLEQKPGEWRNLAEIQNSLIKNYTIRWPLLTGYGYLLLGLIFLLIIGLICHFHIPYSAEWFGVTYS